MGPALQLRGLAEKIELRPWFSGKWHKRLPGWSKKKIKQTSGKHPMHHRSGQTIDRETGHRKLLELSELPDKKQYRPGLTWKTHFVSASATQLQWKAKRTERNFQVPQIRLLGDIPPALQSCDTSQVDLLREGRSFPSWCKMSKFYSASKEKRHTRMS
jgi:hypothetical protein